jgi:hypothetical protein
MGKTKKPSEIPPPDRDPEVKTDFMPEEPELPEKEPEISPEREPDEPFPPEVPVPPKKEV